MPGAAFLEDAELQQKALQEIIKMGISVRETEKLIKQLSAQKKKAKKGLMLSTRRSRKDSGKYSAQKVKIQSGRKSGKIVIEYYSPDELDRIINLVESIYEGNRS